MDINRANMDLFFTDAKVEFTNGLNAAIPTLIRNKVGMVVPSKTSITKHGWLTQIPAMREWVGDRVVNNLKSASLAIANRKFENTVEITREEFEDDEYGLYLPTFGLMGKNAQLVGDRCMIDGLVRGTTDVWAGDGVVPFSAAGRSYDGTNAINNYVTTAYDAAGTALAAAYAAMTAWVGHAGMPLMVQPRYIVHGPQLRTRVQTSLSTYGALLAANGTTYVGGNITNPNANLVEPIEVPWLVNGYKDFKGTSYNAAYYWFVIGEVMGLRAGMIYQERIAPEMQDQRARLDSEYLFQFDKIQWGVRARGEGFIGLPHMLYGGFATA